MKFLIVFALALAFSTTAEFRTANSKLGIFNGENAAVGQFPYQVGLYRIEDNAVLFGGGSLIGKEWVLTAAHCIDGAESVTVLLGSNEYREAEIKHTVSHSNFIPHPEFNRNFLKNDIAVIRIPPTRFTNNIQPVKLPVLSRPYSAYVGRKVIASGWGIVSDTATVFSKYLQWGRMEVIETVDCSRTFLTLVNPTKICVSTSGAASPCSGDSGGPLVLEPSYIQIGVTSFSSPQGCTKGHPAVFTRVTNYLSWIKGETGISY